MGNKPVTRQSAKPIDNLKKDLRRLFYQYYHTSSRIKTTEMIGCPLPFLIKWLDYQMSKIGDDEVKCTSDNYGLIWHIVPFKIPVKKYDMSDPVVRLKFFNWSNLFVVHVYNDIAMDLDRYALIASFLESVGMIKDKNKVKKNGNKIMPIDINQVELAGSNCADKIVLPNLSQPVARRYVISVADSQENATSSVKSADGKAEIE